MEHLKPKLVRKIFNWGLLLGVLVCGIGICMEADAFVILGMGMLVADMVFDLIFYRCPYCKAFLYKSTGEYCPYCGEKVDE